ncbi:MAG: gliding motility-associated C-terminal domain-containing protein [Flavobacteriales bacterium]|nr:gliding motility-associated C-terminal domain-containing protein [Flavobacteriales bacterium]
MKINIQKMKIFGRRTIVLLGLLTSTLVNKAQTTFRTSYDIAALDIAGGMVETPTGDFVFAGTNTSFLPLYGNITKVSSTGNVIWSKAFVGGIATQFNDLKKVSTGGYIAAGGSDSNGAVLVRIDDNGNLIWAKRYSLPNRPSDDASVETANSIIETSDGGFLVGGSVDYFWDGVSANTVDTTSAFGFKVNSAGVLQWSRVWTISTANPDEHYINDVAESADGYFFVGESSEGTGTLDSDGDYPRNGLIIKTDLSGNLTYIRRFGGSGNSQGLNAALRLSTGDILVGGYDNLDAIIVKLQGTGSTPTVGSFSRKINGSAFPPATFIVQDLMENSDGNYSVIGTEISGLFPTFYSTIFKLNSSTGALIFGRGYSPIGLSSILPEGGLCSDQGYYMVMTDQQITGFNYNLIRTDASGNMNDPDAGCPPTTRTPSLGNYTMSFSTPTSSNFNLASEGTFTPVVNNLTPTVNSHCLNVICTPPVAPTVSTNPSPATICQGASVTLTASGGTNVTYHWYTVSSGGTAFSNSASTVVSPTTTTTYYVEAEDNTNPGCVSSRTSVTVTVNPLPNVVASPSPTSVCSGNGPNISLSSTVPGTTSSTTFAWTVTQSGATGASNGSGSTINQTLTASGVTPGTVTYTVTPTSNGCTGSTATVTVTVNPIPTATATPSSTSVCSGNAPSIALTSNVSGTTFAWTVSQTAGISGGSNSSGSSISQTLSNSGTTAGTATYTVTPTANGCSGTAITATITVNPAPVATATPSTQTICSGNASSIALSSNTANTTYAWTVSQTAGISGASNGSGSSIAQTISNSGTTSGTATYTVTPTANGCNGSPITATVTVNPTPVATATPSTQTICSGNATSIALGSNVGGTAFNWTVSQSGVTGGTTNSGSSIAQTLSTSGTNPGTATYTVTPTANSCNGSPITVTITVNVTPDLTGVSASNTTICAGQSTTLNASGTGATSFDVYDAPTGGTLLGATPLNVSPGATTTYYIEAANSNGCGDLAGRQSITVTVIPVADPSWTSPGATCIQAGPINLNTLITGTSGGTWSGTGVSGNIFDPTGLAGQIINITYTVGTSPCVQTLTQSISVQATITATWNSPGTMCESDGVLNLNPLITGTAGGTWSGTGVSGNTFDPTGLSGTVNITYTVGVAPCQDAVTNSILVNASPLDPTVNASSSTICNGETSTITASGSGANITYNIYDASGNLLGTSPLTVTPTVGTTNYFVEAVNQNGCTNLGGQEQISITVNANPNASAGNDVQICPNTSTILTASGGGTYNWETGETTASISVNPTSNTYYSVTVTNAQGCSASDSVLVSIYNAGSIDANNDSTYVENTSSVSINTSLNDIGNPGTIGIINNSSNGTYTVNGTTITYDPNDNFIGYDTITYVICDAFCSDFCDTAIVVFRVTEEIIINVPGGFSPNGDGINDNFVITGLEKYPENELYIYNRWGELVFQAKPYTNNWNGQSNTNRILFGEDVVDGTYFYVLKLNDTLEPLRGSLELRRK